MARPQAVIIGVGDGLSAAVARELATDHDLTLAARSGEKMRGVAEATGANSVLLDATVLKNTIASRTEAFGRS